MPAGRELGGCPAGWWLPVFCTCAADAGVAACGRHCPQAACSLSPLRLCRLAPPQQVKALLSGSPAALGDRHSRVAGVAQACSALVHSVPQEQAAPLAAALVCKVWKPGGVGPQLPAASGPNLGAHRAALFLPGLSPKGCAGAAGGRCWAVCARAWALPIPATPASHPCNPHCRAGGGHSGAAAVAPASPPIAPHCGGCASQVCWPSALPVPCSAPQARCAPHRAARHSRRALQREELPLSCGAGHPAPPAGYHLPCGSCRKGAHACCPCSWTSAHLHVLACRWQPPRSLAATLCCCRCAAGQPCGWRVHPCDAAADGAAAPTAPRCGVQRLAAGLPAAPVC